MAFLLVQFRPQTAQILRLFGRIVAFSRDSFALALFVVEAAAVLLCEALDVFVLRHGGGGVVELFVV